MSINSSKHAASLSSLYGNLENVAVVITLFSKPAMATPAVVFRGVFPVVRLLLFVGAVFAGVFFLFGLRIVDNS